MTDTTAQEADLLQAAADCLKRADGANSLEEQQMNATAALANTTLAAELRARRGPPPSKLENDEEFEARVRRNYEKWGRSPHLRPPLIKTRLLRLNGIRQ